MAVTTAATSADTAALGTDVWAYYANDPEEGAAFARAVPSYDRPHRLNRRSHKKGG